MDLSLSQSSLDGDKSIMGGLKFKTSLLGKVDSFNLGYFNRGDFQKIDLEVCNPFMLSIFVVSGCAGVNKTISDEYLEKTYPSTSLKARTLYNKRIYELELGLNFLNKTSVKGELSVYNNSLFGIFISSENFYEKESLWLSSIGIKKIF